MSTVALKKEQERDLVWLPKDLVDRVKDVQDEKFVEDQILAYIEKSRREIHDQLDCFNDDVLAYRGALAKAKLAFKEAQETHYNETYELWEDFQKKTPATRQFVEKAVAELAPLKTELETINGLLQKVSTYDLERWLTLLEKIAGMDLRSKEMLGFLFENFVPSEVSR
jgi:hypothetical protein